MSEVKRPLEGVKVLELATFIAAPCCARFLADLGAEVIKVEAPAGDPLRYTAVNEGRPQDQKENTSYDLEKLGGTFSEEKLLASVKVYNRHNDAMRKIDEVLAKHPEITATQRSDIFKSAFFMAKEEHTELVEALIAKLEAQTPAAEKLPIVISGILTDAPALNTILDEMGLHIVADDVAAQSRQYRTDAPERADALNALAEKFAAMDNCSVLYNQDKPRVQWIVDTARARNAKGVLVVLTKFCDPEEFDYVMIKKACEAADLPLTLVEVDRQMVRFEQIRTNLETFRDLLKM